ncbi:hypothetical protein [Phenylobacterium sp.]|uniref:hypothetical protein n=1 Tax=Phenylobacterium sp. TaxID=1871053 RepID=UPI0035ADECA4
MVDVSEIVVIGQRPWHWPDTGLPPGSIAFQDGYYGIWKYLPDGNANPDYPSEPTTDPVIKWSIDPNTPESQALALKLGNTLVGVLRAALATPDQATITTSAGTMTGAQLRGTITAITNNPIRVVYNGDIPGAPGLPNDAAVVWENGQPHMYVTPSLLASGHYGDDAAFPNNSGMNFVVLHEMAHTFTPVQQQWNSQIGAYYARTGASDQSQMWATDSQGELIHVEARIVEQYANNAAISVANYFGLPVYTTPKYGS